MSIWKQERVDNIMREIEYLQHWQIAELILQERFYSRQKQYECDWLDALADHLRDGDSFNEMELRREHYDDPLKDAKQRYMNQ